MNMQTRIESLHELFSSHQEENTRVHNEMMKKLEAHSIDCTKLQKLIYGNGNAGVAEQLRVLERFANSTKKIIWMIIPAIILGAAATIWDVMSYSLVKN